MPSSRSALFDAKIATVLCPPCLPTSLVMTHDLPPCLPTSLAMTHNLPPRVPTSLAMTHDLLNVVSSYYMILRQLFYRLVVSLGMGSSLSMQIIAFWLWLQGNGLVDFLKRIDSFDDYHVFVIASCAEDFIEMLHIKLTDADDRSVSRSEFQREAIEGILFYLNRVCYKVFQELREKSEINEFLPQQSMNQDYVEPLNDRHHMREKHLLSKIRAIYGNTQKHQAEGPVSTSRNAIQVQTSRSIVIQHVNEDVYGYHQPISRLATLLDNFSIGERRNDSVIMQQHDVPRDERTLFVTFSNGYPLTKDDLHDFFMRHYGDIEEITIEEPIEDRPPLYAHVTFYSQLTLFRVLNGNKRVKFIAKGKHLWARQFVPKKKKLKPDEL